MGTQKRKGRERRKCVKISTMNRKFRGPCPKAFSTVKAMIEPSISSSFLHQDNAPFYLTMKHCNWMGALNRNDVLFFLQRKLAFKLRYRFFKRGNEIDPFCNLLSRLAATFYQQKAFVSPSHTQKTFLSQLIFCCVCGQAREREAHIRICLTHSIRNFFSFPACTHKAQKRTPTVRPTWRCNRTEVEGEKKCLIPSRAHVWVDEWVDEWVGCVGH